jgi:hypothetical protein
MQLEQQRQPLRVKGASELIGRREADHHGDDDGERDGRVEDVPVHTVTNVERWTFFCGSVR